MAFTDRLRWPLFSSADKVLVAVSGGPDSLSLLHVLWTEREAHQLKSVEAAHLDHGLRGKESTAEAAWVSAWCAKRGIVCHVGKADAAAYAKKHGHSTQEAARAVRYAFLEQTAEAIGADKIATGHTRDDQVETILGNILRGTGLEGLRGIPEERGKIVRPLLNASRAEVEAYCLANALLPRQDPSNLSSDHYTRNRIRLELLPQLRHDYNAGVDKALLRLSEIAARDSDYLMLQARATLTEVTRSRLARFMVLARPALAALHPALLRSVLRMAIAELRGTSAGIHYELLEAVAQASTRTEGPSATFTFPHPTCIVWIDTRTVTFTLEGGSSAAEAISAALPVPGEVILETIGWRIQAAWEDHPGAVRLDADTVEIGSLHVRTRRTGDRIDPLGMGGQSKKLSKIFSDAKISRAERDCIPVIDDGAGIVWVAGHTQAERTKVTPSTTRVLFLSVQPLTSHPASV